MVNFHGNDFPLPHQSTQRIKKLGFSIYYLFLDYAAGLAQ